MLTIYIFDIYFRYFLTGNRNFNAIDSSFIDSVAFQCPYVGGAPVFMARGMYNHINDTIYFNDSLLCETIGSRIANAIHSNNYLFESWILLYPNPSDNFVKVSFYKANAFKKYRIVDAIGQMVEEKSICFDCQELVIDVTRFKSGVYFIVMNDENGYRELKKMVVLHE